MLNQRLVTSLVLIPLFVWGILSLPTTGVAILCALFVATGAWEWASFIPGTGYMARASYSLLILVLLLAVWSVMAIPVLVPGIILIAFAFWLYVFIRLIRVRGAGLPFPPFTPVSGTIMGGIVLVPAWLAVIALHASGDDGPGYVLFLFALVWTADISAYAAGRRWGRHKLAPEISPGKTWEGAYGSLILAVPVAAAGALAMGLTGMRIVPFILLSMVTVVFSITGDLLESGVKRQSGVKDSGMILPGHGGILDRIDSLTAAAPVFFSGLMILGVIR